MSGSQSLSANPSPRRVGRRVTHKQLRGAAFLLSRQMLEQASQMLSQARGPVARRNIFARRNAGLRALMRAVDESDRPLVARRVLSTIPVGAHRLRDRISEIFDRAANPSGSDGANQFSCMRPLAGRISEKPLPTTETELFDFVCSKLRESSTQNLSSLEQVLQQLKQRIRAEIAVRTSRRSTGLIDRAINLLHALQNGDSFDSNSLHASSDEVMPLLELLVDCCGARKFMNSVNFSSFQGITAFTVRMSGKNKIVAVSMQSDDHLTPKKAEITNVPGAVIVTFYLLNSYALSFKIVKGNGKTAQPTLSIGSQHYALPPHEHLLPLTPKSMQGVLGKLPASSAL